MFLETAQWDVVLVLMGIVLLAVALLALAGLPIIGVTAQMFFRFKGLSAYDKCARQLAMLGMILGWGLTFLGGIFIIWTLYHTNETPLGFANMNLWTQGYTGSWICLACGTFFLSLYHILWRTLKDFPVLHQCLGLVGMLFFYLCLFTCMAVIAGKAAYDMGETLPPTMLALLVPPATSTLWNALAFVPALALSLAGALGALWLGLRRHRDDYGRDYYMRMFPWCVMWARNGWAVLWLMLVAFTALNLWQMHRDVGMLEMQELIHAGIFVLMWAIPTLVWSVVVRSTNPLRHKLTTLLALVLSLFFVGAVYLGLIGV